MEDNNKMNLMEIGWGSMDWIYLAQYRSQWSYLVNTVMILQVQLSASQEGHNSIVSYIFGIKTKYAEVNPKKYS
jgi:hypothetical protein